VYYHFRSKINRSNCSILVLFRRPLPHAGIVVLEFKPTASYLPSPRPPTGRATSLAQSAGALARLGRSPLDNFGPSVFTTAISLK